MKLTTHHLRAGAALLLAMERNNQNNYWEALGKVECPDM
jgi:hypothetical protein